jgi:uncharacterized protein (DUF305 family)
LSDNLWNPSVLGNPSGRIFSRRVGGRSLAGVVLVLLATAAVPLAGRSGELGPLQAQAITPHWSARMGPGDQRFIEMMVPHHEGAIAMADLALTRARRPEIKALARSIKVSQSRENEQMRRWYRQWYGRDMPSWEPGVRWGWHHGGMMGTGMGSGMDPGMGPWMGTNLEALRQAADFDRGFIEQMIPHHQMGVMMATMELGSTQRPEMRQLAEGMIKAQSEEITAMQRWYRSWYR